MARIRQRPKSWDRFAHWAPGAAILTMLLVLALLAASVLTGLAVERDVPVKATPVTTEAPAETGQRDTDLQLYDSIIERVADGENYYAVAVEEQRARDFPVRPAMAVRLPTLATVSAWATTPGMVFLAILLAIATLIAWWLRLRDEDGGPEHARFVLLLLVIGAATGFKLQYLVLHDAWAGVLVALSLGLHRPGEKWLGAWISAALALSVRELALPFVLLMGTLALLRGHRGETIAWGVLMVVFALLFALHLSAVNALTEPQDRLSDSWLALRGLAGATGNVVDSTSLHLLPLWLAAPLAVLPLLGWAGWRSATGLTGFLLCLGYGVFFMIAGRENNFYWALLVTPVWFIGYAFVPRAVASLWNSALGR